MADDQDQEKRHDASESKKDKASEKGQIARSQELSSATVLVIGFAALGVATPRMSRAVQDLTNWAWSSPAEMDVDTTLILGDQVFRTILRCLGLPFAALVTAAIVVGLLQTRFRLAPKSLEPKLERLDALTNAKQKFFSAQPFMELAKGVLKLVALGGIVWISVRGRMEELPTLALLQTEQQAVFMATAARSIVVGAIPLLAVLAIADYAYNTWKLGEDLKMTDEEVKQERKEQDGDPLIKAQRRARARQIAMSQAVIRVKEADLILTNPTHYAVALRYRPEEAAAPVVIAMGVDHMALKIRQEARRHDVPRVENRALARALYARSKVGQPIPEELFAPVAKVLAVVYKRRRK